MRIQKRVVFAAAHSISGAGKCANKHGHNWEAVIEVETFSPLDKLGFIADVAKLKEAAFKYDHDDLDKYFDQPSTENVAQRIADDALDICVKNNPNGEYTVNIHLIETENNSAYAEADNCE